jgi:hypothetical protein
MSDWGSACGPDCGWCGGCTDGPRDAVKFSCAKCGDDVWVGRREEVGIHVWCDRCLDADRRQPSEPRERT